LIVPWYWTDDIARALIDAGRIGEEAVRAMMVGPTAIKRDETTLEAVALALLDEDEIPLAA
jgi:hypothetical protein